MLDKLKFTIKQTVIYSFGNLAFKLVGFILLPLYSKYISIEEYGLLALFEIITELIMTLSTFRIDDAFKRWYWDKTAKGKQKSLFFTIFCFSIFSSLILLIAVFIVLNSFSKEIFDVDVSSSLIILLLVSSFTKILTSKILFLMRNQQKAKKFTVYNVIILILTLSFTVLFIVFLNMKLKGIFLAQIIANSLAVLLLLNYTIHNIKLHFEYRLLKEMIRFSFPLFISGILSIVLNLSDRYIIRYILTLEDVGHYSLAYKFTNILRLLVLHSFIQAYSFIFYKGINDKKNNRFFIRIITYYTYTVIFIGLGVALFSREIIETITFNKKYWYSYHIIPFLILSVSFLGMRQLLILPLSKLKKTKTISIISASGGITNIILNFIFIPIWGTIGAAAATALTHFLAAAANTIILTKTIKLKFEYFRIFIILASGIILFIISKQSSELSIVFRIPIKIIIISAFPLVLYFTGFYEKIELTHIKNSWHKWKNPKKWKENLKNIKI